MNVIRTLVLVLLAADADFADAYATQSDPPADAPPVRWVFEMLGTHHAGRIDESAAEIVAWDPQRARLFVTDGSRGIRILDASEPTRLEEIGTLDAPGVTGVAVRPSDGLIAWVAGDPDPVRPGRLVLAHPDDAERRRSIRVGPGPDMVTFSSDGRHVVVAVEAEPVDLGDPRLRGPDDPDIVIDPAGSVVVVPVDDDGMPGWSRTITFEGLATRRGELEAGGGHFPVPGRALAAQIEPEYVVCHPDAPLAFVSLQESNLVALVDLEEGQLVEALPLAPRGFAEPGRGLDTADRDGAARRSHPRNVVGLPQPDGLALFTDAEGRLVLVTANEGEPREGPESWEGTYNEVRRVAAIRQPGTRAPGLDPETFGLDPETGRGPLLAPDRLGRLKVSYLRGDTDGDGDLDRLHVFGTRSASFWILSAQADGRTSLPVGRARDPEQTRHLVRVHDTGDDFERITAEAGPFDLYNASHGRRSPGDRRSDDRGPEPEGVVIGEVEGRRLLFVGLERAAAVIAYDITDWPTAPPRHVGLLRREPDPERPDDVGDLEPEGLLFVPADETPDGFGPWLVVANEYSGTTTVWSVALRSE